MMLKISEAQALEQSKPLSMISPMIVGMGAGIGIAILLYAFLKSILHSLKRFAASTLNCNVNNNFMIL